MIDKNLEELLNYALQNNRAVKVTITKNGITIKDVVQLKRFTMYEDADTGRLDLVLKTSENLAIRISGNHISYAGINPNEIPDANWEIETL